jgi:alkaline phosphatase D
MLTIVVLVLPSCRLPLKIAGSAGPRVDHGPVIGEVSATAAIVWARCNGADDLHVALRSEKAAGEARRTAPVQAERDHTARIALHSLAPETSYEYRVWCSIGERNQDGEVHSVAGAFRTAPLSHEQRALRFAWGGDIGGQNVCRDRDSGYAIFDRVQEQRPSFFVALGDMIYADNPCTQVGRYGNAQFPGPAAPALDLEQFWAWWRYNRADPVFRRFLTATPTYAIWDDHEIKNDAGPLHDTWPEVPNRHLLPVALQAFLDYQPLLPPEGEPTRLYRNVRWGRHAELFILDTRQYRDANFAEDDEAAPKTMLGEEQGRWFLDAVAGSDATWKVVVSSVPISVPTGRFGRDGWADFDETTGFERELASLLKSLWEAGVSNLVWLTTDVHFGAAFRYAPIAEDSRFRVYEFISGPMNAGVFPSDDFDTTLGTKRLFRYGPAAGSEIGSFAEATAWFNFGVLEIDAAGELTARLVNGSGLTVFRMNLFPRSGRGR